jgi:DNA-binding response OmpR family regulator
MKKNILIIDDDEEICNEMKEILQDEGYLVETANDGINGLDLIKKNNYDIILQDLKLPGINGIDILKYTKKNKPDIKVIVLTGRPLIKDQLIKKNYDNDDKVLIELSDGLFNKPFNIITILNKINEL